MRIILVLVVLLSACRSELGDELNHIDASVCKSDLSIQDAKFDLVDLYKTPPDLISPIDLIISPDLAIPICTKILGTEQNAEGGICIPYELIWSKDCQLHCPPTLNRGIFNAVYNDDTGHTVGVSSVGVIRTSGAVYAKNCVTPTFGTGYSFWLMQDITVQPTQSSVKGHVTCWWPTYAAWPGGPNNYLFNEGRYHYFK